MISLSHEVQRKLADARLVDQLALIQEECDQHGYLVHLTAILGSGGFGTVFLADLAGESVAIKVGVPRPKMERVFVPMCEEEGRKACQLSGIPHLAAGIEYWFSDAAPLFFLVSRYIHGLNLKTYQDRVPGPIAEHRLRAWALQLTEALTAMHQRGLVHRDVKPENILLEQATDQVFITDLGVAKYAQHGTLEALRTTGTHPYAPMEQILGRATYKSDQYALGMVLFELATGIDALPPVAVPRLGYPVARPARLEPRRYNQALSADLAAFIERLAALKPGDRFPSMQAAHEGLALLRRLPARQRTEPMAPATAPKRSPAPVRVPPRASVPVRPGAPASVSARPDAPASAPERPAFAWRPLWQLRLLLLGGPIQRGGPALSPGGVIWLMLLYLGWALATGWSTVSTWAAISGQRLDAFWLLVGATAIVLWRIARTWNVRRITRRGSLSAVQRRTWMLLCLAWGLVSSPGVVVFWFGTPAPIWTSAWLETIGGWATWVVLYVSLEMWLN